MSGGPPQHPHGRQAPPNSAWNHLQVPNFYPTRQPQHAHMSSDLSMLATHQPTWHTPTTTEPTKSISHSPLFNLQQMLGAERPFAARHSPGVDLTLTTRNGNQNGDLPQTPISLSVRDAKQINSLALDSERAVELTKGPSPGLADCQPKNMRRPTKRMDSIIDRLNTTTSEKLPHSVIVQATSSHDENSNSSQGLAPILPVVRDDDVASPVSNEDSLDSNKSRRKRKPCKTIKLPKEDDSIIPLEPPVTSVPVEPPIVIPEPPVVIEPVVTEPVPVVPVQDAVKKSPVRRRSSSEPPASPPTSKSRRKTVSESETIDNIAAMIAATSKEETPDPTPSPTDHPQIPEVIQPETPVVAKPVSVITRDHSNCSTDSVLKQTPSSPTPPPVPVPVTSEALPPKVEVAEQQQPAALVTLAQKKGTGGTQNFVAVEDELEKMFAGIADSESEQLDADPLAIASTSSENVSSTSNDLKNAHKRGRPKGSKNGSRRPSECNSESGTPRKKHKANKTSELDESVVKKSTPKSKKKKGKVNNIKEVVKDVYSYDSGSNSSRSKGPFIQIKGPRDSPISVSIVNTPSNDDDADKPKLKNKKFHDDSEYRHKVRSKGLHCSTLSNKYDAQTRDATWICVFCKRGPHATDPQLPGPSPFTLDTPQYSPGDLFGPYIISIDCPEYQRRLTDPFDSQFKSKRAAIANSSPGNSNTSAAVGLAKKSKRRLNSESSVRDSLDGVVDLGKDVMFGIAEVTAKTFEVWVHEDCVIWAPGVYLVGPKILGLEGAVWVACSVACKRCGLKGAAVCCLKRGCGSTMHIGCAKLSHWKLDEENYKAYCTEHH